MALMDERKARTLTTHVGSLPRPDTLSEMMAEGDTEGAAFRAAVMEAVKVRAAHAHPVLARPVGRLSADYCR